ncbi:MAG: protein phosphatase 2C domain-containing protein [Actinobacteria bacterium]|nr:protein phosphatase 2C domain-containing protein [Actinomycetota bacterium]
MTVLRATSATDVGAVRAINQDLALVEPWFCAVADGMGGHVGGEVAARVALEALSSALSGPVETLAELVLAVKHANQAVWEQAQGDEDLRGMGTTITAMATLPDEAPKGDDEADKGQAYVALANVGDSRAYLWRAGALTQLTEDHSVAEELLRRGELTESEAAVHPHRHILTRALGVSPLVQVDAWRVPVIDGDRLLLCSDGLTNELSDTGIAEVFASVEDIEDLAHELVSRAYDHGGSDNITTVVAEVAEAPHVTLPASPVLGAPVGYWDSGSHGGVLGQRREVPTGSGGSRGPDSSEGGAALAPVAVGLKAVDGPSASTRGDSEALRPSTLGKDRAQLLSRGGALRHARSSAVSGQADLAPDLPRPRRITLRVGLFVVLLLAVLGGAAGVVDWYAKDSYYVGLSGDKLVIYQGRPGGFLWFKPEVAVRTGVSTAEVLPIHLAALSAGVEEPSLAAARTYVSDLVEEKRSLPARTGSASATAGGKKGSSNSPPTSSSSSGVTASGSGTAG